MKKVAVVYWSGTGNTAAMADLVAEGARNAGADVSVYTSAEFNSGMMSDFQAVAFGCPAMGAEVLEETEFEPMFNECEAMLGGKCIALFGSYGWGDGEWMRNWEDTCKADGAVMACEPVICNEAPDGDASRSKQQNLHRWFFVFGGVPAEPPAGAPPLYGDRNY